MVGQGFDVYPLIQEIDNNPFVWNRHKLRTETYGSPHTKISDIWVRYNDWSTFTGDINSFNSPHESVWYPVCDEIPSVKDLIEKVLEKIPGKLGGVLITKVPPKGCIEPHIDVGWHAGYYEKFAVQLKGNKNQAFCFEDACLSALPGDLYTFDNSKLHWVFNNSDEDRMTLIICIKRK